MTDSRWKGKGTVTESIHFQDLEPVLIYRHLHSNALGVRDPFRVVSLIDSDAFYAACEMARLGIMDKPLVVSQWESLIAVNYPARKFGITRFLKVKEAKELCPELQVVHVATYKEGQSEPGYWDDVDSRTHKVSLDHYRRESSKILAMFKECLPGAEIEKASIDEAFIDLTKPVKDELLRRYPFLANIPPSGLDSPLPPIPETSWHDKSHIVPITPPPELPDNAVPAENTETLLPSSWHDIALSIGAELMEQVREKIKATLTYTTSAGVARNKFLAKLVASYRKPDSQTILRNAAIPNYLKPLAFQKIRFLGGKFGDALAKEYGVATVGELLPVTLEQLQHKFGDDAIWVYQVIRGVDRTEVKEKTATNKSMLASKNLPKPVTKASEGQHWIRVLAAELALRLNEARESSPHLWPKTLVLHAKKGYETGRSKQTPFPFTRNVTVDVIAAAGDKLWHELVGGVTGTIHITSIQLAFTGIESAEMGQQSIDGFFSNGQNGQVSLKRPFEKASGRKKAGPDAAAGWTQQESDGKIVTTYTCTICGTALDLRSDSDEDATACAARIRQEHSDHHYAEQLAKTLDLEPHMPAPSPPRKKVKKGGIESFFHRR